MSINDILDIYSKGCLLALPVLATVNASFGNGRYIWMPVWLPELYPTRIGATALAFAFNGPRFIAFLGPLLAGTTITQFGGFGRSVPRFTY